MRILYCLHSSHWRLLFLFLTQLVCRLEDIGPPIFPSFCVSSCCLRVICGRTVCQLLSIVFGVDLARYREYGLASLPACLAVWFLAATAVSFSSVIPPRIWQSLFCNRLELQVPVGWRETKPKETDDGGKIEINPNSVWWSECFYLTLVVVKIIGKKKSLLCAWSLLNVCEKSLYENIVPLSFEYRYPTWDQETRFYIRIGICINISV